MSVLIPLMGKSFRGLHDAVYSAYDAARKRAQDDEVREAIARMYGGQGGGYTPPEEQPIPEMGPPPPQNPEIAPGQTSVGRGLFNQPVPQGPGLAPGQSSVAATPDPTNPGFVTGGRVPRGPQVVGERGQPTQQGGLRMPSGADMGVLMGHPEGVAAVGNMMRMQQAQVEAQRAAAQERRAVNKEDRDTRAAEREEMIHTGKIITSASKRVRDLPMEKRLPEMEAMLQGMVPDEIIASLRAKANDLDGLTNADLDAYLAQYEGLVGNDPPQKIRLMEEYERRIGRDLTPEEAKEFLLSGGVNVNFNDPVPFPAETGGMIYRRNPDGSIWINKDTGLPEQVDIPGARPSEREINMGISAESMAALEDSLKDILESYPKYERTAFWNYPGKVINWFASAAHQQYDAVADEWSRALVFLQSGATARDDEVDAKKDNYFPRIGDDDATVSFKEKLRVDAAARAKTFAGRGIKKYKPHDQLKLFYREVNGKEFGVTWEQIVATAKENDTTPVEIMRLFGIKERQSG